MQHTLLPKKERDAIRGEYRIRALIVFFLMLALAGIAGIVALSPAYALSSSEERTQDNTAVTRKTNEQKNGTAGMVAELSRSAALLNALGVIRKSPRMSGLIADVIAERGPVSLSSLSILRSATTSLSVAIQGVSPTRAGLLSFKDRLAGLSPGGKVDLPLSELAKSADIQFSIELDVTYP